jgi:hypothetical protein
MTSNAENEKRGELAGRVDGRYWAEQTTDSQGGGNRISARIGLL